MRRVKRGHEYIVFAGGGVERGETIRAALQREIREEFSLEIGVGPVIVRRVNSGQLEYYFYVSSFRGQPKLGGEESLLHSEHNQYHPTWYPLHALPRLPIYPASVRWGVLRWLVKHGHASARLLAALPPIPRRADKR